MKISEFSYEEMDKLEAMAKCHVKDAGDIVVSDPVVMRSAAGWYVGEVYAELCSYTSGLEYGPYSRLTDYLASEKEAIALYLQVYVDDGEEE